MNLLNTAEEKAPEENTTHAALWVTWFQQIFSFTILMPFMNPLWCISHEIKMTIHPDLLSFISSCTLDDSKYTVFDNITFFILITEVDG